MNELSKNDLMEIEGGKVAPWYKPTTHLFIPLVSFTM